MPVPGHVATTNGESVWTFRYSSEGTSWSLCFSTLVDTLRPLHLEVKILHSLCEEAGLVISETLGDLPGGWNEIPVSAPGVSRPGSDEMRSLGLIAS